MSVSPKKVSVNVENCVVAHRSKCGIGERFLTGHDDGLNRFVNGRITGGNETRREHAAFYGDDTFLSH